MKSTNPAYLLLLIALVAACGEDSGDTAQGGDYGTAKLALGLTVDDNPTPGDDNGAADGADDHSGQPLPVAEQSGEPLSLTAAQIYLRHIELDLPAGVTCAEVAGAYGPGVRCESSDDSGAGGNGVDDNPTPGDDNGGADDSPGAHAKLRIAGPFVVDLIARTSSPSLADITIPALTYRRVDMRIDDGAPLGGYSMVAAMDWSHKDQPYTVRMALKFNEDIRIEPAGGVSLQPGDDLMVLFNAADWIKGLPLATCLDDGDLSAAAGMITLDDRASGGCSDVENTLKDAIKRSGRVRSR